MKTLKEYVKDTQKVVKESQQLDYDEVLSALMNWCDGDEFVVDMSSGRTGRIDKALKYNSLTDILDYHCGWDTIAQEIDTDEETLQDFYYDNQDALEQAIEDEYC